MPRVNEDIMDSLRVLTETGVLDIPIMCETKKCKISVTPTLVQFGNVPLGETKIISFKVVNTGAIATNFEISQEQSAAVDLKHNGYVGGYSTAIVEVSFKAAQLKTMEQKLVIKFSERNVGPFELVVQGAAVDILVYTETNSIDLQTCYLNQLYREVLLLKNRGATVHHCIFLLINLLQQFK